MTATDPSDAEDRLGWWTISGIDFLRALHLVHDGADPDVIYAEYYANSDHEHVEGDKQ